MQEEWKEVVGFEGCYEVSNKGRVRSLDRRAERLGKFGQPSHNMYKSKLVTMWITDTGYLRLTLNKEGKKSNHLVHRLVANAFIPNVDNKETVNHKNGVKADNQIDNLEWATRSEQNKHAWAMGLNQGKTGWRGKYAPTSRRRAISSS
jgi:hypothetical protein